MSNQQTVQSKGIYHGLPVYPSSLKGLTAIITGANGISGNYMLRVLAQDSERWSKIYCLSRRPPAIPNGLPNNAEHIALDFLKDPQDIAAVLKEKGVKADYVFFYSYVQAQPKKGGGLWSDAEEMCSVNRTPLKSINPITFYNYPNESSDVFMTQYPSSQTSSPHSPSRPSTLNASCSKLAQKTTASTSVPPPCPKKKPPHA
jgi:hypothetical protein